MSQPVTVYVVPSPGLLVQLDAMTRRTFPPEGKQVRLTSYIQRRINDGSLSVAATQPSESTKPKANADKKEQKS